MTQLHDAVRRVIEAAVLTDVDDETAGEATRALHRVAESLERDQRPGPTRPDPNSVHDPARFFPFSPLVGPRNPLALPLAVEVDEGRVVARGRFPWAYQGPPGHVHGGVIASVFDELLGYSCIVAREPGMTGRLTIKYRNPTPLHTELVFECRRISMEGRRITATGECRAGDVVTAEAEGLFVKVRPERALELFGPE
jgi:acyl-coenzyme A thioesterase PaaI-like protein